MRTLIGAGIGAALGLGYCALMADGQPLLGDAGPIALVAISISVGGLIGYAFER